MAGDEEEDEAEEDNTEREILTAGDNAEEIGGFRLAVALCGDARGCVEEAEEAGEGTGRGGLPAQAQDEQDKEDEQPLPCRLKELGRVAGREERLHGTAHRPIGAAQLHALLQACNGSPEGHLRFDEALVHLRGRQLHDLQRELHGDGIRGICHTPIELTVDEVCHTPEEEPDGADNGQAITHRCNAEAIPACVHDRYQQHRNDATMRCHASLPHTEHPEGIRTEATPAFLRQPVEKELAQARTTQHTQHAHPSDEIAQLLRSNAVKLPTRKTQQYQIAQHEAGNVGQPVPAQG